MARCARCGAANDPRAASCVRCGTTLGAALPGGRGDAARLADVAAAPQGQASRQTQGPRQPYDPRQPLPSAGPQGPRPQAAPRAPGSASSGDQRRSPDAQPKPASKRPSRAPTPRRQIGPSFLNVLLPFAVVLVLVAVVRLIPGSVVPSDSPVFRLFRPEGGLVMTIVPAFILIVFAWTMTYLFRIAWLARRAVRDLRRPEIGQLPAMVGREPFPETLKRLRSSGQGLLDRRVGQRVAWLLHHLDGVDPGRGPELLRNRSELDENVATAAFRPVGLLVLAMPVMGLVGTVLGVGIAAGGFSEFLVANTNLDGADRVTTGLTEMSSGLSYAFDSLLFGLLAGVVAGVVAAAVRAADARILAEIDELSLDVIAQIPAGAAGRAEGVGLGGLDRLEAQTERLMKAIDAGIEGLTHAIADMRIGVTGLGDRVRQIEDVNKQMGESITEFGYGITSFRNAQSALTPVLRRLSGPLEFRLTSSVDSEDSKDLSGGDGRRPKSEAAAEEPSSAGGDDEGDPAD